MSDSKKQAGSFLKGAGILAAAGILSRLIGLFFKVPLYALVGSYGNGIYGSVYSIYNTLLMISTVGLPVGISKMISEAVALKDYRGAKDVFSVATMTLVILGGLSSLFLFFGANWLISVSQWAEESYPAIMAIAAAPFIISVCSAFRGFFQGFQIMKPTAISQIIEQIIRVGLGILLAWLAIRMGYGVGMAVGGAVFGATIGGAFAVLFLAILYLNFMKKNRRKFLRGSEVQSRTKKQIFKRLLWISIPVTLTSSLSSLFATVNSFMYVPQLGKAGVDAITATTMYGDFSNVDTLIGIPLVISGNICVAIIPAISESFALKDRKMVSEKIDIAIRVCLMVALPCCVGLSVLSQGIFDLLFPGSVYGPKLLQMFSYVALFTMIYTIFQSVLQAIDKMFIPMITLAIGTVIHIVSSYFLMAIPSLNIFGIGIGDLITFLFLAVANYYFVYKITRVKISWFKTIFKPLLSAIVMGGLTYLSYVAVKSLLGNVPALVLAVIVAILVYVIIMVMIGGVSQDEIDLLPAQRLIQPVYDKIIGWRNHLFRSITDRVKNKRKRKQ